MGGKTNDFQHKTRASLARIYFIDQRISSGKYPNNRRLAREYEVSAATINRDIEYMRCSLNAPIEYDAKHRGWYYTEKTYRLPAFFTGAGDMLALRVAKNLLALYKDTPLYEAAKNLLENITAPLSGGAKGGEAWYENRIIVPPPPAHYVDPALWETLCTAMRENRAVSFEYEKACHAPPGNYTVHPWQLLFDNGSWLFVRIYARLFSPASLRASPHTQYRAYRRSF